MEWALGADHPELAASIAEDCLFTSWDTDEPGRWLSPLVAGDESEWAQVPRALAVAAQHATFYQSDALTAAALARRATELDAANSLAHAQAAIACIFTGDSDNVVAYARRCVDTATDEIERALGLLVLGNSLLFTGRADEAAAVRDDLRRLGDATGYPTAIASARHLAGILLAETDPEAALVEFRAGLDDIRGLDRFVAESNLRREMIALLTRIDPQEAVRAAADLLEASEQHNDTGQSHNALAYLVTILHGLDAPELAAEVAGHIGNPLLAPTDAAQYHETDHALRDLLGEAYQTHVTAGKNRSTRDLMRAILDVLEPHR